VAAKSAVVVPSAAEAGNAPAPLQSVVGISPRAALRPHRLGHLNVPLPLGRPNALLLPRIVVALLRNALPLLQIAEVLRRRRANSASLPSSLAILMLRTWTPGRIDG
jgi:hypothetical protein